MVEVTGLEPAASASRTQRSTKLSHTSLLNCICAMLSNAKPFCAATPLTLAATHKPQQILSNYNPISPKSQDILIENEKTTHLCRCSV